MSVPATSLQAQLRATVAAITGHRSQDLDPEQFLECDLGIDSIKMVELSHSLLQLIPESQRKRFRASVSAERLLQVQTLRELEALFEDWDLAPPSAPANPAAMSASCAAVLALVARITGHRPQDLDLDMFLERDLGIDSIKMIELAHGLLAALAHAQRANLGLAESANDQLDALRAMHTVGDIVRWFEQQPTVVQDDSALDPDAPARVETLPLLPSQYVFLVGQWAVSTCSLATRVRLQGPFDLALARRCWGELLARHPALRSRFVIPPGAARFSDYRYEAAVQVPTPELTLTDLSELDAGQQDAVVATEVERCVNRSWTLQEPLLHRFFVLRLGDELHEVFFTNHHLVSDGMSNQLVMREFLALYAAGTGDPVQALTPSTTREHYSDVVAAIDACQDAGEDRMLAELLRRQGRRSFAWHPNSAPRASERAYVKNHRLRLDLPSSQALLRLTGTLQVSMNSLLVSAYLRAIAAYEDDPEGSIFLNIPTSGRVYPGVDASGIVGCFAQNLVLDFARPTVGEPWAALVRRVHDGIYGAIARGCDRAQTRQTKATIRDRMPLEDGRLADAHCALLRAGMKSNLYLPYIGNTHFAERYGTLRVLDYQAGTVTNAGTLDTVIELFHGALEMTTNYDANHFDAAQVAQLGEDFLQSLRSLAAQLGAAVSAPSTLPVAEAPVVSGIGERVRQVAAAVMHRAVSAADTVLDLEADLGLDSLERIRIVTQLLQFAGDVDPQRLLACRRLADMAIEMGRSPASVDDDPIRGLPYLQIAAQCARTPQAVAVWTEDGTLSYGDLHRQSNQLARHLHAQGLGRGSVVGLMLQRGPRMLVAILAVMKAGAAYVPLDPDYPAARLRYMIDHARVQSMLAETAVAATLAACLALSTTRSLRHLVYLDEGAAPTVSASGCDCVDRRTWSGQPTHDLDPVAGPDDAMVVLYTSGSSGSPKGVRLGHAATRTGSIGSSSCSISSPVSAWPGRPRCASTSRSGSCCGRSSMAAPCAP